MVRIISVIVVVLILVVFMATSAFAQTPNTNSSHVAQCAAVMGGQHVAECAKTMEKGVSTCDRMSGPCEH